MAIGGDFGVRMTSLVLKCGGSSLIIKLSPRMMANKTVRAIRPIRKERERIKKEIKFRRWFRDE